MSLFLQSITPKNRRKKSELLSILHQRTEVPKRDKMLRQFLSKIQPTSRLSGVYAARPLRFFCVNQNFNEKPEDDKLYKSLEIELRGHDHMVMTSYAKFARAAATHLEIDLGDSWTPKLKYSVDRYTILKSAYVHKKHRVQYDFRTYYRYMHFHRLTGSTMSTFLEYIERNLPEGVAMKATKVELLNLPEHLQVPPSPVTSEQIE